MEQRDKKMPNYQSTRQPVAQQKNVNYLSKDFDSIKRDLIDYLQRYYPDDYQDFNEASGGMAIIELLAYLGDAMSFFIDRQVNEGFIDRAIEPDYAIRDFKSLFPDSNVVEMPNAGHYSQEDEPELLINLIKEFMRENEN